jgi:hypothetical protein
MPRNIAGVTSCLGERVLPADLRLALAGCRRVRHQSVVLVVWQRGASFGCFERVGALAKTGRA